ncbi:MAG: hypothetical protein ACOX60_06350 [Massiliimalia sp.]|jgi:hypothetical protein
MGYRNKKSKKLRLPYYPYDQRNRGKYSLATSQEKAVIDYTGLNLYEVLELDYFDFLALLRDAMIFNNMQTTEGQEYLENCWRMEQTEPDRKKLRARFG